jgi:hypothetical protein
MVCQSPSDRLLEADASWVYSVEDCIRNRDHRPYADTCEYYSRVPHESTRGFALPDMTVIFR